MGVNENPNTPKATSGKRIGAVMALALTGTLGAGAPTEPLDVRAAPSLERIAVPDKPRAVTAPANADIDFTREMVTSYHDEDRRLRIVLHQHAADTSGTLSSPLAAPQRTSPFGGRISPITGDPTEFHSGQDFGAPCGTDIRATAAGTVISSGWHPYGGGNRVEIDHGDGLVTTYNHLTSSQVSAGQKVHRGQPIATVGTTGASTGCHLHFEVVLHGEHIDPAGWL